MADEEEEEEGDPFEEEEGDSDESEAEATAFLDRSQQLLLKLLLPLLRSLTWARLRLQQLPRLPLRPRSPLFRHLASKIVSTRRTRARP